MLRYMVQQYKRGEIYYANLGDNNVGSEQSGTRPVLIIQNNIGNRYSPTIIVACMTSRLFRNEIPTHVRLDSAVYALPADSLVLCEQIKTIDKQRLASYIATLNANDERRVNTAIRLSLSL